MADLAGVCVGTFHLRSPKLSDLIKARLRGEIDACADAARDLEATLEPDDAVAEWLMPYASFMRTKKGLATALHPVDNAYADLPGYFQERRDPAPARSLHRADAVDAMRTERRQAL
ncbi:MAG: hypothetical protein AAGH83_02125 [Pseudomonadota bacterium]